MTTTIRTTSQIRARLPALREELKIAGFDFKNLSRIAAADESVSNTRLRHLLRLFHLHEPIERAELESVFSLSTIGTMVMTGLVAEEEGGAGFRSSVFLTALQHDLYLVSDHQQTEASTLRFFLPRHIQPKRIIDVGTGAGALALLAARLYGSDVRITAVDSNERAINACTFNAALNGISTIETCVASLEEIIQTHHQADLLLWDTAETLMHLYEAFPRILTPKTGHATLHHTDEGVGKDVPGFQTLRLLGLGVSLVSPRHEGVFGHQTIAFDDASSAPEALIETAKADDWQRRIQNVPGWSSYTIRSESSSSS